MSVDFAPVDIEEFYDAGFNSVFHSKSWLGYLSRKVNGEPICVKINHGDFFSYFVAIKFKKFGVSIIGGPLLGWSTPYMNIMGDVALTESMVLELGEYLIKKFNAYFVEFSFNNHLAPDLVYEKSSLNVLKEIFISPQVSLGISQDEIYKSFQGDARTFIRQFEEKNCRIEICKPEPYFIRTYIEMLEDVFERQQLKCPHSFEYVTELLGSLPLANVLCLVAKTSTGISIGAAIVIHDLNCSYLWGCASKRDGLAFRPIESLIWFAIKELNTLGCKTFDLVGDRSYKNKFSPKHTTSFHYVFVRNMILLHLRRALIWFVKLYRRTYTKFRVCKLFKNNGKPIRFRLSDNLHIIGEYNFDSVHYADCNQVVVSRLNKIYIYKHANGTLLKDQLLKCIELPLPSLYRLIGKFRLVRRLFRLDKIALVITTDCFIIWWRSSVYCLDSNYNIKKTLDDLNSRCPMHNAVAVVDSKTIFFGEYGNPSDVGKRLYATYNCGESWSIVHQFGVDEIRHIHNCVYDKFRHCIWVLTGDSESESSIYRYNIANHTLEKVLNLPLEGSRATGLFVENDCLHWFTDTPNFAVRKVTYRLRDSKIIHSPINYNGPIYYYRYLNDGVYLVSGAAEPGSALVENSVKVYASRNLKKWSEVASFDKDVFNPYLFRFGTLVFSGGNQSTSCFWVHLDSVVRYDGCVLSLQLRGI